MAKPKLAIVVGSNLRDSINRKLAEALAKLGADSFEASFVRIDDLPLYSQDLEAEGFWPAQADRLKSEIAAADAIIFGPGDLYTSTIPNLLVKGVAEAVRRSSAKKILITNLMTKHGQTDKFKASDFVKSLESYLGKGSVDAVIVNSKKPAAAWIARHKKEHSEFVEPDTALLKKMKLKVLAEPLLNGNTFEKNSGDVLKRSYLRHDPDKLAKLILDAV